MFSNYSAKVLKPHFKHGTDNVKTLLKSARSSNLRRPKPAAKKAAAKKPAAKAANSTPLAKRRSQRGALLLLETPVFLHLAFQNLSCRYLCHVTFHPICVPFHDIPFPIPLPCGWGRLATSHCSSQLVSQ